MQKINPTRQELLRLKKRLKIAKSGHKLLQDKLDGLIKEFLSKIDDFKSLRKKINQELPLAFFNFYKSYSYLGPEEIESLLCHLPKIEINKKESQIMGVRISKYEAKNKQEIIDTPISFYTDSNFINSRKKVIDLFDEIIQYFSLEKEIKTLSYEIERNRRRINSLEHILIPEIIKNIKYIYQKLEEGERFNRTVLMKVKTLIVK